jgi:hypothetical protein
MEDLKQLIGILFLISLLVALFLGVFGSSSSPDCFDETPGFVGGNYC